MMTTKEIFESLQVSVGELVETVKGQTVKWNNIVNAEVARLQNLTDTYLSVNGAVGSTSINVASGFSRVSSTGYAHIKTPIAAGANDLMYLFKIRGYEYGLSKIIDADFVGYSYLNNDVDADIIRREESGTHEPTVYTGSDGFLVLRISLNTYFATVVVDSTYVGAGKIFKRGDFEVLINESETI